MFLLVWCPIVFVRVISLNSCRREQGHELQLNHRDRICSRKKTARKKKIFLEVFPCDGSITSRFFQYRRMQVVSVHCVLFCGFSPSSLKSLLNSDSVPFNCEKDVKARSEAIVR